MPREWLPASPPVARREVDLRPHEAAVIDAALAILECRLREPSPTFERPEAVKAFVRLHLTQRDRECFGVLFMDNQHRLIAFELLFAGTLNTTAVHPREVVRRGLQLNAAAVILAHNHPSGSAEPSRSDEEVTEQVQWALQLVGMRVLDHVVVGAGCAVSFAERGLL
jgi:DNA repair protein RadC